MCPDVKLPFGHNMMMTHDRLVNLNPAASPMKSCDFLEKIFIEPNVLLYGFGGGKKIFQFMKATNILLKFLQCANANT